MVVNFLKLAHSKKITVTDKLVSCLNMCIIDYENGNLEIIMEKFYFNQSMIAELINSSTATISRAIATLNLDPIQSDGYKKKFDIECVKKITKFLYASNRQFIDQKIQVFYNFKGGTGKTSMCFQVATHLSILGYRVLCLDLDPQGHLSSAMGMAEDFGNETIYDVLINHIDINNIIVNVFEGLDFVPSNISLTRIEVPLSIQNKREEKLKKVIESLKDSYDFILMDTNPTISTLNMNAIVASDRINIVCETQPFSLYGLRVLVNELKKFCEDMSINPSYCIIPNKYEIKTATAQEVLGALRSEYGDVVINTIVRKSEDINVSSKKKLPVSVFCKPRSTAFEDVMDLVHEIVRSSLDKVEIKRKQAS
jgi:chromosome partitioning protein